MELLRRVEDFSGVIVLAYAIMSNHFHIFIYVPEPEELGDDEILRRINVLYRDASLSQVLGEWTRLKDEEEKLLERARPTGKYVSRFGEYRKSFLKRMWNSSEFMRVSISSDPSSSSEPGERRNLASECLGLVTGGTGAVIAKKIEKEESGARLRMR